MALSQRLLTALLVGVALASAAARASGEDRPKPLKVFVLAGQSNMQGHASVSTFESLADDPKIMAPIGKAFAETYYLIGDAMGTAMKKLCGAKPAK